MDDYTRRTLVNLYTLQTMLTAATLQALEAKGLLSRQEFEAAHRSVLTEQLDHFHDRTKRLLNDQAENFRWQEWGIGDLWGRTDSRPSSAPDHG